MHQIIGVLGLAVWAAGLVAFGIYIFRGHWRWLLWSVLGLVVIFASAFLHQALLEREGYRNFVDVAARIGVGIVIVAASALVADLVAIVIYVIRYGESGEKKGTVVRESRGLNLSLTTQFPSGRSTRKILGSKSSSFTIESFVDGTATFRDRMMAAGMITLFISFFLVFVGVGLILMKGLPIMVLFPVVPGLFVYNVAREAWHDYQKAKESAKRRAISSTRD